MDNSLIIGGVTIVIGGAIVGFFVTKKSGFGRFNTAVLLLMLVLYVAAVAFSVGRVEVVSLVNLLFAIAGYAGGLLTGKDVNPTSTSDGKIP